jgi:hypothetical protein
MREAIRRRRVPHQNRDTRDKASRRATHGKATNSRVRVDANEKVPMDMDKKVSVGMNKKARLLTNTRAQAKAQAGTPNRGWVDATSRNRAVRKSEAPDANAQTSGKPPRASQTVELVERETKRTNATPALA